MWPFHVTRVTMASLLHVPSLFHRPSQAGSSLEEISAFSLNRAKPSALGNAYLGGVPMILIEAEP